MNLARTRLLYFPTIRSPLTWPTYLRFGDLGIVKLFTEKVHANRHQHDAQKYPYDEDRCVKTKASPYHVEGKYLRFAT